MPQVSGPFDEHWETRRIGRRGGSLPVLISRHEHRFDLPPELSGHPLSLRLEKLDGELDGPLHATVVPSPPTLPQVLIAGAVLVIAGAFVDASSVDSHGGRRTRVSLVLGFLAALSALMLDGITPTVPAKAVVALVAMSAPAGLAVGWLAREVVGRIWPGVLVGGSAG